MPPEAASNGITTASLDNELREAVEKLMAASDQAVKQQCLALIQELLDRKAALLRAPFSEKVRRIKEAA